MNFEKAIAQPHMLVAGRGMPEPERIYALAKGRKVWTFNISTSNTGENCSMEGFLQAGPTPRERAFGFRQALSTGSMAHELLSLVCSGDERDSYALAQAIHDKFRDEQLEGGLPIGMWAEKMSWVREWLADLAELYRRDYWPQAFDRVLANEEPMWLFIPVNAMAHDLAAEWQRLGYGGMLLMFRPDLVIEAHGAICHLQRKTKSRMSDLERYVASLSNSMHEAGYTVGFAVLLAQGDWGQDAPNKVGGSIIELIWSNPRPPGTAPKPPKKIMPEHNPKILGLSESAITFSPDISKIQLDSARSTYERWKKALIAARHEERDWEMRVIQHHYPDCDLVSSWQRFDQVVPRELARAQVFHGHVPPRNNERACFRYGSMCQYFDTKHCFGRVTMNDNEDWRNPPANYVSEFTESYETYREERG